MTNMKVKRFEEAIILSLLGTWFIWFTGEPTLSGHECIIIFCMMLLMACFASWLSSFRASKKQDHDTTTRVRMSYSMKLFLLGIVLIAGVEGRGLLQEYTDGAIEIAGMIDYFCAFSVIFMVALKGCMSMHMFGLLISFRLPREKDSFQIEGKTAEQILVALMLIVVAIIWLVVSQKFLIPYPVTLIRALLLSLIISIITKLQTILQPLKNKTMI